MFFCGVAITTNCALFSRVHAKHVNIEIAKRNYHNIVLQYIPIPLLKPKIGVECLKYWKKKVWSIFYHHVLIDELHLFSVPLITSIKVDRTTPA